MSATLTALRTSVAHLRDLVEGMDSDMFTAAAYPQGWSVAETLSHLGSGAVITKAVLEWSLAEQPTPDDFMPRVWDEWNAKTPEDQVAEMLVADSALLEALEAVAPDQAVLLKISMEGRSIDFAAFVQHRLSEHALHSWDIAVAVDPSAALLADVVPVLVDGLGSVAEHAGRPIDDEREIIVHTFEPARVLRLELGPDAVLLEVEDHPERGLPELHLPGEALIRLVYGRMDVDHTPHGVGGTADLDELRRMFPGF